MSDVTTFTVSAEGGLVRSTKVARTTLAALNASTGELREMDFKVARVAHGATTNLAFDVVETAHLVLVRPDSKSSFGADDASGVTITVNGAGTGIILRGRALLFLTNCEVTALSIANNSGSEISAEVILAGK